MQDKKYGIDDGIEMRGGHMEVKHEDLAKTQEFKIPDTVFEEESAQEEKEAARLRAARTKAARIQKNIKDQYHWDESEWDEVDDEAMLERLEKGDGADGNGERRKSRPTAYDALNSRKRSASSGSGAKFTSQKIEDTSYRRGMLDEELSKTKKKKGRAPRVRTAHKAPGRSHAGLIIGLIFAVLVVAAIVVVLVTGVYRNWFFFWEGSGDQYSTSADSLAANVEEGQEYTLPLEITLESKAGNRIYYTLDGTEPNISSLKYDDPVRLRSADISEDTAEYTLRAVTYSDSSIKMDELKITFTVRKAEIDPPETTLPQGTYTSRQGITLSAEKGATIYYTYDADGSIPTTSSAVYSGTIEMLQGENILSAIAVNGSRVSQVVQYTYTLNLEANYSYDDAYNKIAEKMYEDGYQVSSSAPEVVTEETTKEQTKETTAAGGKETETTKEQQTTTAAKSSRVTIAVLYDGGTETIAGSYYYVIWVQLYYEDGREASGMYYGVDTVTGAIEKLANNDGSFSIS